MTFYKPLSSHTTLQSALTFNKNREEQTSKWQTQEERKSSARYLEFGSCISVPFHVSYTLGQ